MHQFSRRLIFSVFFVSIVLAKFMRLYINVNAFAPVTLVICLPAFFIPDALFLAGTWGLLQHRRGRFSILSVVIACFLSFVSFCASVSLISFWWESGGEIQWNDAASFALDAGARKVAMSGSTYAIVAGATILVLSFIAKDVINHATEAMVSSSRMLLEIVLHRTLGKSLSNRLTARAYSLLPSSDAPPPYDSDEEFIKYEPDTSTTANSASSKRPTIRHRIYWGIMIVSVVGFFAAALFLERGHPYGHLLAPLPLSLLSMFNVGHIIAAKACHDVAWPLPDLTSPSEWEYPSGNFKGWAPGTANEFFLQYRNTVPDWLPSDVPRGFARWAPANGTAANTSTSAAAPTSKCSQLHIEGDHFYNPVNDPLKISNFDQDVLSELRGSMKLDSVNIKHVVIFQMESMRQELFPLMSGSDFHKMVLQSHPDEKTHDEVNRLLAELTPNVQKITGRPGNFVTSNNKPIIPESKVWNDTTKPGFGGLNVIGTHTTCTSSIKSLGAIHCGVWPMPVDSCKESRLESYQPCFPRVFNLFNEIKNDTASAESDDYRDQMWSTAFFQSIADDFDDQKDMDRMIGFDHVVTKKQVEEMIQAGNSDAEEINYFGFAETTIKQNIKDYITKATADNQRMFFSHFTSTTHHPWGTPDWFKRERYLGEAAGGRTSNHEDMDHYLNAIHFNDGWVGQVMQMLEDAGVADETLVVFVGDHGQAFKEDARISGTYQNGHISNFRVPLVFHHPLMPRVHLNLNSSSINILPTVLDLLISTGSLNEKDTTAASDIVQDYEGQSLIRPFKTIQNGRRSWNFGIVNPGARFLAITSADEPYRLVMPWDGSSEFVFTNLATDVLELNGMANWSLRGLIRDIERRLGPEVAQWVREAEAVAQWWGPERKRLWQYHEEE